MTGRSYLSIGDVLTLLRQEFPDITISKIRFLESQGLVDPERTPSGYRKFYQHDVDRLRWVLQQQRENFLPLKVIKDRLEVEPEGVVPEHADPASPVVESPARPEPVLVGPHVTSAEVRPRSTGLRLGDESVLPGMERPAAPSVSTGAGASGARPADGAGPMAVLASLAESAHGRGSGAGPAAAAPKEPAPAAATGPSTRATSAGGAAPSGRSRARSPKGGGSGSGGRTARGGARRRSGAADGGLSAADVAEASALTVESVDELASFGLLQPKVVAGFITFDDADLAIAKLAGQLERFGIEARHLRLYKNSADREAGFVEQVVLPLLRQRNPDARDRAAATAEELASVGRELRSCLLQRSLRGLLEH